MSPEVTSTHLRERATDNRRMAETAREAVIATSLLPMARRMMGRREPRRGRGLTGRIALVARSGCGAGPTIALPLTPLLRSIHLAAVPSRSQSD